MSHRTETDELARVLDELEQLQDAEAFAIWQAEYEQKLRWKALAKRLWRQLQELRGKLKDGEAR